MKTIYSALVLCAFATVATSLVCYNCQQCQNLEQSEWREINCDVQPNQEGIFGQCVNIFNGDINMKGCLFVNIGQDACDRYNNNPHTTCVSCNDADKCNGLAVTA